MVIEKGELIQSVYVRYMRGIGYERVVAKEILDKLLKKQGLSLAQYEDIFCSEEPKERLVKWMRGYYQLQAQILFAYLPEGVDLYTSRKYVTGKNTPQKFHSFTITERDWLEIQMALDVYITEYKKEVKKQKKTLYIAFIHTNHLFSQDKSESKSKRKQLTPQEIMDIQNMMKGIDKVYIRKGLEHK